MRGGSEDTRSIAPAEAARDDGVPERIGRYVVSSVLGAGGMGMVYAAFDPTLQRKVALKVVRLRAIAWQDVETARRRLLREGQALAALAHPNVVPIFDVGSFRAEPAPERHARRTRAAFEDFGCATTLRPRRSAWSCPP